MYLTREAPETLQGRVVESKTGCHKRRFICIPCHNLKKDPVRILFFIEVVTFNFLQLLKSLSGIFRRFHDCLLKSLVIPSYLTDRKFTFGHLHVGANFRRYFCPAVLPLRLSVEVSLDRSFMVSVKKFLVSNVCTKLNQRTNARMKRVPPKGRYHD